MQELGITSDEALSLEEFPKRAVILGGGCVFIFFSCFIIATYYKMLINIYIYIFVSSYIAVEFASIWRGMGSTVHLAFRKELPLRFGFDMTCN